METLLRYLKQFSKTLLWMLGFFAFILSVSFAMIFGISGNWLTFPMWFAAWGFGQLIFNTWMDEPDADLERRDYTDV